MPDSHITKVPVSVLIITRNEEIHIERVLASVQWSDNVVVVDSHSTDGTRGICEKHKGVAFVERDFVNFAHQRQSAIDAGFVKHPWLLCLDADEAVSHELAEELAVIASMPHTESEPVLYELPMRYIMWGRWLKHSTGYPVYFRRFFMPRSCRCVQRGHGDTVETDGPIGRARHDLIHENLKGIQDWREKHERYCTIEAGYAVGELEMSPWYHLWSSDPLRRKRALKRLYRHMPFQGTLRFVQLYLFLGGFLDGKPGFEYCLFKGRHNSAISSRIRELRARKARSAGE